MVGNSHITALRWACRDRLFRDPTFEIVFWGAPGTRFLDIQLKDGTLVTPDARFALHVSGGNFETIVLDEFDALVFQGPTFNPNRLFRTLRGHQLELAYYSAAALREGIFDYLDRAPATALIRQVRSAFKGCLLASPRPLIAEQSNFYGDRRASPGDYVAINEIVREYFDKTGVLYVPQPATTIAGGQYTATKFCVAINDEKRDDDFTHMNPLYGVEVLQAIAKQLNS